METPRTIGNNYNGELEPDEDLPYLDEEVKRGLLDQLIRYFLEKELKKKNLLFDFLTTKNKPGCKISSSTGRSHLRVCNQSGQAHIENWWMDSKGPLSLCENLH
jgi:hypothetical protein